MKTYKLHLIRHALTAQNLEGKYIGQTDVPASKEGLEQVKSMIKDSTGYPKADVVISSPLKRCTETAKLIYPDKEPILMEDLIEYDFGDFEGHTADELKEYDTFKNWLAGTNPDEPVPFGESQNHFSQRICSCFEKIVDGIIKSKTENTVIITHGGIIMTLMEAFAIPEAPAHEWLTPSGCGYTLRVDPSLWRMGKKLEAYQECPALPEQLDYEREQWGTFDYDPDNDPDFDVNDYVDDYTDYEKNPLN